ncbi:unnamed protein product [Caenorhabditis auriculariae]|uniref:26S proteasome regulatory subunit RPN2 C-terminal domain-containing protein n=1 Tax=Caenorhabditis auriculariae TaxID=2777116 RepID=A0A8S1GQK7_9PELO|nr:unnamed protein product [Caenorhabditis auriculariae]
MDGCCLKRTSHDPEICLSYVGMLVEHFNPYVRYGACMALGIACSGSGYKEAVAVIEPLLQAKENFVRQGAVIALSFILIQQTEGSCPNVVEFRKQITKMVSEKGEDSLVKFGSVVAQGILDAGGRNVTISLRQRAGHVDISAAIGMMLFLQYWYWHTMTNFISLAMRPTAVIALNKDLKMPKMQFKTSVKPALYAYPPPVEPKKKDEGERVETAVLSISNKKKQRRLQTMFDMRGDGFEDFGDLIPSSSSKKEEERKPVQPQDLIPSLQNPARVVRLQLKTLSLSENSRHVPIKPLNFGGVVIMKDTCPMNFEELVPSHQEATTDSPTDGKVIEERKPHAAFEIDLNEH